MSAVVVLIASGLVLLTVALHLFLLRGLARLVAWMRSTPVMALGISVVLAIMGHLVEIWVFAVALYWMANDIRLGSLVGDIQHGMRDYFYCSAITYTSLGFGDIAPKGALRLLAAIEAITGLVLIAWTASFVFLAMQNLWSQEVSAGESRQTRAR